MYNFSKILLLRWIHHFKMELKNKTNHPTSSNSHPTVTANKSRHLFKVAGVYKTSYQFLKLFMQRCIDGHFGRLFFIRDTNKVLIFNIT